MTPDYEWHDQKHDTDKDTSLCSERMDVAGASDPWEDAVQKSKCEQVFHAIEQEQRVGVDRKITIADICCGNG